MICLHNSHTVAFSSFPKILKKILFENLFDRVAKIVVYGIWVCIS